MRTGTCKGCGAQIVWIKSAWGKMIPCDAKLLRYRENPEGREAVVTEDGNCVRCDLEFEGLSTGMARKSHFATCPEAAKFRRRGL